MMGRKMTSRKGSASSIWLVNYHCNNRHVLVLCTHAGVCTLSVRSKFRTVCTHVCTKFSASCIVLLWEIKLWYLGSLYFGKYCTFVCAT
jgi:hypothetical protein